MYSFEINEDYSSWVKQNKDFFAKTTINNQEEKAQSCTWNFGEAPDHPLGLPVASLSTSSSSMSTECTTFSESITPTCS